MAGQGFGILTESNVRSTFEAKLGAEAADAVGDYVILGACNSALASRALAAEPEIGALLPCNVVVRRGKDAGTTTIEAIDPQIMVQISALRRLLKRSQTMPEVACPRASRLEQLRKQLTEIHDVS